MKKLFTLRSFISWLILLVAMSALVAGLKEGIRDVQDAAFLPVAAFAVTLGYVLGFSTWSGRRVWSIILISGLLFILIEIMKLAEPLQIIIRSIPQFEVEFIRWLVQFIHLYFEKNNHIQLSYPNTTIFQIQFAEIVTRINTFMYLILSKSIKHPSVRKFIWDLPLLLLAAWAGWGTSRRKQTLLAIAPSLVLHTYILQYTNKDAFSLLFAVFALILLIGVNQKWNLAAGNGAKTATETYSAILVLSIALTVFAGFMPSISIRQIAQEISKKDNLGKSLGLEKEIPQGIAAPIGLPRQHLIGLSPALSQTVIFTVQTGEIAPSENAIIHEAVPRHYWRWLTYDVYNGQGWGTSPTESNSYSANNTILPIADNGYKVIHQQVEKASAQDSHLYWTGSLTRVSQPFTINWRTKPESLPSGIDQFLNTDMLGAATEKQSYQADSILPMISADQLRTSSQTYPQEIRNRYLALPKTIPQRVLDLAQKLTSNISNPYDQAKAIETYLRTYPYSLDVTPPPPNRDVADYFLFDLKRGYCDYYATSMVVMARAVGLPARLVVGYSSGIYNPIKAEYIVREANAHSWVEIYFAGVGWVEFEPTASQPPITLPEKLPEDIGPSKMPLPKISKIGVSALAKQAYSIKQGILLFTTLLVFIILFAALWFLHAQGLAQAHGSIGSIYKYVYYHGKKVYKNTTLHETPSIFADKLQRKLKTGNSWLNPAPDEIRLLTDLYLQETYSAHSITKNERIHAVKVWRKLFWRLLYARIMRLT